MVVGGGGGGGGGGAPGSVILDGGGVWVYLRPKFLQAVLLGAQLQLPGGRF